MTTRGIGADGVNCRNCVKLHARGGILAHPQRVIREGLSGPRRVQIEPTLLHQAQAQIALLIK
jgi:hypothetical protein